MKRVRDRRIRVLAWVCVFSLLCTLAAWAAESAVASSMQLMKTEGSVSISDGEGKAVSLFEKMRLHSGYQMKTEESSYAWINLDSSKLIKMDAASTVAIQKSGKQLEVRLDAGGLFFNVSEPLAEDETLNIRVSTMIVGVRGTSGWVRVVDPWTTQVYILDGTVQCSVTDPVTGQSKTEPVKGGEMVSCVVYPQEKQGDKCDILRQSFTGEDIAGFILTDVVPDGPLCDKIYESSGIDLRHFKGNPLEKLRQEQAAVREKLADILRQVAGQDNQIATKPVWANPGSGQGSASLPESVSSREEIDPWENTSAEDSSEGTSGGGSGNSSASGGSSSGSSSSGNSTPGSSSSGSSSSGSSSSGGSSSDSSSSGSSSSSSSTPEETASTTLTMPVTAAEIQAALNSHDEVTIQNP